jgi:hypothetical protein
MVGAAMKPGEAFDFAAFDEAHKTAGREGRNFAFALDGQKTETLWQVKRGVCE